MSNTISHMINWLVVFYGVALRIMESQNWWFGDPKESCKKHIQSLQNRRVQWFLRWTRENNKKHQHNTSELFRKFYRSQKNAPTCTREIHHVGKMMVSHSITPTQQDARVVGDFLQQITRWLFFATHLKKYATLKLDHLFPQVSGWVNKQYLSCHHSENYHTFAFFDPSPSPGPPPKKQGCLMIPPCETTTKKTYVFLELHHRQFHQAFSGPRCRCMEVVTKRAASESNWVWGPKRMSTNPKVICNAQNHDVKHESSGSSWWFSTHFTKMSQFGSFPHVGTNI